MSILEDEFQKKYKVALVTGAAGFIGSHITEKLISLGLKVIAVDDLSAGRIENIDFLNNNNLIFYQADISKKSEIVEIFRRNNIDVVFNNAASKKNICLLNPSRDLEVNAQGTLSLLELSKKYKIKKFVHASSGSVYGEAAVIPQTEDHPINPVSYYGVSKLAGERYVKVFNHLHNINTTILRYFHVYGPRQDYSMDTGGVISIFIKRALKDDNLYIHGDGTQERSFTYVEDVVNANLIVATKESTSGEFYNIASGININLNSLKDTILSETKSNSNIIYDEWLVGDIKKFNISNQKIRELGLRFTNFEDGLSKTILAMKKK